MNTYINSNIDNMIKDLTELINIPSVYGEARTNAPFGAGVNQGLEWVLSLAESFHMNTKNYDGYAGEVTIGSGDFMVGILCHVDVVAGGNGWTKEPFCAVKEGDRLYGRGALDDKGPIISSLYAMRYIMEEKILPENTSLRMIIGTNEEESWEGIAYYKEKASRLPDLSIVPDGSFPVIFCEKGLLDFNLKWEKAPSDPAVQLAALGGGDGRNVVPSKAYCKLTASASAPGSEEGASILAGFKEKLSGLSEYAVKEETDGLWITAFGKSTHCMSPEKGLNAIGLLIEALGFLGESLDCWKFVRAFNQYIGMDYHGTKFGCGFEDELSGKLTFNIGTIAMDEKGIRMESNLRYPASRTYEAVLGALKDGSEAGGFVLEEIDHLGSICFEKDSPLIKMLMTAYREVSGDEESQPIAIGGATYARAVPSAVAFGPLFPDEEELAHEPDEFIRISSLKKMTEVYIKALALLLKSADKFAGI